MGGYGSGRKRSKPTEIQFVRLQISQMQKWGMLQEGGSKAGTLQWNRHGCLVAELAYELDMQEICDATLSLHAVSGKAAKNIIVALQHTTPNYGGKRWWFECPSPSCVKRAAVLYYCPHYAACRECWKLAYSSQSRTLSDRYLDRAFKMADAIGLSGNLIEGFKGDKPKGMHWSTYSKKVAKIKKLAHASLTIDYDWFQKKYPNLFRDSH